MADSVSSSRRSEIMSHIKSKDTSIELLVRRKLFSMGYRYRVNYKALPENRILYSPERKLLSSFMDAIGTGMIAAVIMLMPVNPIKHIGDPR